MKAISIWQPHASLLLLGPKRYETRGWRVPRSLVGTRVAIHAAKADGDLREIASYAREQLTGPGVDNRMEAYVRAILQAGYATCGAMPRGCIIGSVILLDSVRTELAIDHGGFGDFTPGRHAWPSRDPVALANPVPFRGMQGFFDVPDELLLE